MDDMERLKRMAPHVPSDDAEARERARLRLRDHYLQAQPARARTPRRRGVLGVILVAAAVAEIVAVVALLPKGGDGPGPSVSTAPSTAPQTLRHLASVAAQQPNRQVGAGTYVYVRSTEWTLPGGQDLATGGKWTAAVRLYHQEWRARDGSGRRRTVAGKPRFLSAADEAAWRHSGRQELVPRVADQRFSAGTFVIEGFLGEFDGTDLRRVIDRGSPIKDRLEERATLDIVASFLAHETSPRVRASLFEVAASLPDVRLIGESQDPVHRPSVAVSLTYQSDRIVVHFDAATSALLATETYRTPPHKPEKRVLWRAYWPPRIVGSLRSRA
jgi:hypothetical protein